MNKETAKTFIKIVGRILMILSVIFVIIKISRLGFDPSVVDDIPAYIGMCFLALALNVISTVVLALAWGRWISFFSASKVNRMNVITIYGRSSIGKYLPGNVMHYVERNLFAAEYGLSQKKIAVSSVMEIGIQVLAAVVISLILLPESYVRKIFVALNGGYRSIIILIFVAGLICLAAVALVLLHKVRVKEILRGYKLSAFFLTVVISIMLISASLLLNAFGITLVWTGLNASIYDPESLRLVISSYTAAWVCGFVIPGAPGGIGVREAILTLLLEEIVAGPILVFVIITHRLITIIGDFTVYAIVSLWHAVSNMNNRLSNEE